jgi:hypothetical protein
MLNGAKLLKQTKSSECLFLKNSISNEAFHNGGRTIRNRMLIMDCLFVPLQLLHRAQSAIQITIAKCGTQIHTATS